jgi:hypothetical protein
MEEGWWEGVGAGREFGALPIYLHFTKHFICLLGVG